MYNFGEGYAHFKKQDGLVGVYATNSNSDYVNCPTPKGYVAKYENEAPFQHIMMPYDNHLKLVSLYEVKNEKFDEEEAIKKFKKHHTYFDGTGDDSIGFHCFDEYSKDGGKFKLNRDFRPSIGKKGCFMSIIKNEDDKKKDFAKYYLMICSTIDEMAKELFESNKNYGNVTLESYLQVDSRYKMLQQAALTNNCYLASTANILLGLGLKEKKSRYGYVNEELQQVEPTMAIPNFYQVCNVIAPVDDGYNLYNHTTPNLSVVNKKVLEESCPILNFQYENQIELNSNIKNEQLHLLLGGGDSKTLLVRNNSNKNNDHYDIFVPKSKKRKHGQVSQNKCVIGTVGDHTERCFSEHLDNVYGEDVHKKTKFDNLLIKIN